MTRSPAPRLGALAAVLGAVAIGLSVAALLERVERSGGGPGRLPEDWQRGFNLTSYRPGALLEATGRQALLSLRDTGTSSVAIVTQWYMEDARSTEIAPHPRKTPTDDALLAAMEGARDLGMGVMLKPHVDLRDGSFRGKIDPADRAAWFESYEAMMLHQADLAARGGADMFVVGVELTSMARDERAFRRLIAAIRERFEGRLTFAANWSAGARRIAFWDALDVIGIDAYMPLTTRRAPSVRQLETAWRRRWVAPIARLSEREGKPVLFTELGYESRVDAAASPHDSDGAISQLVQARAYEAAYRVWSRERRFEGIYWWNWPADADPVSTGPGSFSPERKLAEEVVRAYNGAEPRRRSGGS